MAEGGTSILDKLGIDIGLRVTHTKTITESDLMLFAQVTENMHPIHVSEEYAKKTRFGGRLIHGSFMQALLQTAQGNIPGIPALLSQSTRFLKPVKVNDTITAIAEVTETRRDKGIITLKHTCVNQRGEIVAEGEAMLKYFEETP